MSRRVEQTRDSPPHNDPEHPDSGLDSILEAVITAWETDHEIAPSSLAKRVEIARRFTRFARRRGATDLDAVDTRLVSAFINEHGRTNNGSAAPKWATMRLRRNVLGNLFRTAQHIGLATHDPTVDVLISTPPRVGTTPPRPLNEEEAGKVRLCAPSDRPSQQAVTAAFLLAGMHISEIAYIAIKDVDAMTESVWAHGSAKSRPRQLSLDPWASDVVSRRIERLNRDAPAPPTQLLCTRAAAEDAKMLTRIYVSVRQIFIRAGIHDNPQTSPTSLTAYAARRVFDRTGRIEDAALLIGWSSLDATALFIHHNWLDVDDPMSVSGEC